MIVKQYSDDKEPKEALDDGDEAASLLLLNELAHNESALWEQAQKLRAAATELNGVGDEAAGEEENTLNRQAGRLESVAKQVALIRDELKADPKKKISRATTASISATITQLMSSTDTELGEADEIKDEIEHKTQEHHQAHAAAPQKAVASSKAKEPKAKEKTTCKTASAKKSNSPTWAQKAVSYGSHIKHGYIAPAVAWGGHILSDLKEDYLDPVLHFAPVSIAVSAAKTAAKTVVNAGKSVVNGVGDTMHTVISGVTHAGANAMEKISGAVSAITGYFVGKPDALDVAEQVLPPAPRKRDALAASAIAQVLAMKMPNGIGMPKAHSVMELLTPAPIFGAMSFMEQLVPKSQ